MFSLARIFSRFARDWAETGKGPDPIPSLLCGIGLPSEAGHVRDGPQFAEKLTAGKEEHAFVFPERTYPKLTPSHRAERETIGGN